MTKERTVLNSDVRYIDNGNLLRSRAELSVAKMLSFLNQRYQYDINVKLPEGEYVKLDGRLHPVRLISTSSSSTSWSHCIFYRSLTTKMICHNSSSMFYKIS
jgi:hypothetical protein